nr:hypothetical protein [Candidatus Freyrarchaeum guaymaensis]
MLEGYCRQKTRYARTSTATSSWKDLETGERFKERSGVFQAPRSVHGALQYPPRSRGTSTLMVALGGFLKECWWAGRLYRFLGAVESC